MYLKKMEICGFKSFMNRLEMDFSGGITAVLGPNGCGKTNIVDSIRWVLGEQKTRMLRNTKMENVIFNGTKLRKPLGMAEVHMTLSNEDGAVPLDYSDVTISRKLYRSGVSEYFINGKVARLKDIRSLLVDTGLGSHTYSIIEREMVDSVISDKDQDKRHLLEEAAGIVRYRIQREEALRKIKHTEADLTRLGDILAELEKEIRSLRYQMGKANRYRRLKEQLDTMESVLLKRSLYELLEKRDAVEKERAEQQGITLADEGEIQILDNRLQESRVRGAELERQLQDAQEQRYGLRQSLQQHEERIAVLSERNASNRARIEEDENEIVRATTKQASLDEDMAGYVRTIQEKEAAREEQTRLLTAEERVLADTNRELESLRNQLRDKKQLALDLVREKERERGVREHLHNRLFEIEEQVQQENDQRTSLRTREEELEAQVTSHGRIVAEARSRHEQLVSRSDVLQRTVHEVVDQVSAVEDRYTRANIEFNRLREKKEYLERIRQEHTQRQDEVVSRTSGVRGVLADHVHVEREYRRCFEACLAPVLQGLLVESRDDAIRCLSEILETGKGKLQLLYPSGTSGRMSGGDARDVLGYAIDFVTGDAAVIDALRPHLDDVAIVKDMDAALTLLSTYPGARVATLDGLFFDGPGRILVAGAEEVEMTLLEFEAKQKELESAIARVGEETRSLEQRKRELSDERDRLSEESARLRDEIKRAEQDRDNAVNVHRGLEIDLVKIREKLSSLVDAVAAKQRSLAEIQAKLESQPRAIEDVIDVKATDDELTRLEQKALEMERRKEAVAERVGKVRLDVATTSGELTTAREKHNNVEALKTELAALVQSRREDAERCRQEIANNELETQRSKGEIRTFHERIESVEGEIERLKSTHAEVRESGSELESQLKTLKSQRDQQKENLQRCDLELATIRTRISGVIEKAAATIDDNLERYVEDRSLFDPAEWQEFDNAALEETRRQIASFGPVNMLAIEEHREKKERFDFLSQQKADLDTAKEDLVLAIRRINKEARKRLSDTFEEVRSNFKQTFLTLFDGGEADLLFVDSDDPLEANIKIVASPKGKRLHDISSLSGGERALVALSLLFAIYLVKPSPFCVFDEVDAPLDDANIGRFVRMLKSFTDRTQFIVITHNKKTMEAADNLYGVTMAEPGVSRMISVHIGEVDRFQHRPEHEKGRRSGAREELPVTP